MDDFHEDAYRRFLSTKSPADAPSGLAVVPNLFAIVPEIKKFQAAMTVWALRRGRAAIFAGTGLGKTLMQLLWAHVVAMVTGRMIIILCPLAVAEQTIAEAKRFGISGVAYAADQDSIPPGTRIVVTNYERFEKFIIALFIGIVLDESGIIKNEDGKTRKILTEACRVVPWRLCCSATPAPNDYSELGQHSEFLGVMDAKEMLAMFFVHDGSIRAGDATQGNDGWRMKRHAAQDFWRWLASWSVMVRHPRDLGFDEPGYDLPALNLHQVTVAAEYKPTAGELFPMLANTLSQRIGVRRDTADARCDCAVNIIDCDDDTTKLSPCYQMKQKSDVKPRPASDTQRTPSASKLTKNPHSKVVELPLERLICEPTTPQTNTNGRPGPGNSKINTTPPEPQNTKLTGNTENESKRRPETPIEPTPTLDEPENFDRILALPSLNMAKCSNAKVADALSVPEKPATTPGEAYTSIIATKRGLFGDFSAPTAILPLGNSGTIETSLPEPSNISVSSGARWIIWCQLNKEQDRIAKLLGERCFSIDGSLPNGEKVSRMRRWIAGERPVLVSKTKIFGYGMNLQMCSRMVFVGASDSFEQVYQGIRRCWRFGQLRPVDVYFIASELEGNVVSNLKRKEAAFELMLDSMSHHMRDLMVENVVGGRNATAFNNATIKMELPAWLM